MLAAIPTTAKIGWSLIMMKMGWIDVVFLIVFGMGVFIGLRKGLAYAFSRLFEVLAAQIIAIQYASPFAQFLHVRFQIPVLVPQVIIFAALAIGSIIGVRFLFQALAFIATVDFKSPFNGVGGALVNGIQLVLLLGLVSGFLALFPIPFIQETFRDKSLMGSYLAQSSREIHDFFLNWALKIWQMS